MLNIPYKLHRQDFDQILFTSDQHYGHNPKWETPLWKMRGFKSIYDHDFWLESEYAKVSSDSIIISLGDPALNNTPQKLLKLFNRTSAPILHIWGNHFSCDYHIYKTALNTYLHDDKTHTTPSNRNAPLAYEIYPFTVMRNIIHDCDNGESQTTTEYSIEGIPGFHTDISTICFLGSICELQIDKTILQLSHMAPLIWSRRALGALCGHTHGNLDEINPMNTSKRVLDCGIENTKRYNKSAFFNFEEVVTILNSKSTTSLDSHV